VVSRYPSSKRGRDSLPEFNVIVPVVRLDLCKDLINSIEENTILPKRVIIINNTGRRYFPRSKKLKIEVYPSISGDVNESWNLGVSLVDITVDYVSILNDDIVLNKWFFQRVDETLRSHKDCGVACPLSVSTLEEMGNGKKKPCIVRMERREGYAFTFRKKLLDRIPPIPIHRIKIFHGDDWYWYWTLTHTHFWYQDLGNIIFHHVGSSVLLKGFRDIKKKERNEWERIMNELGG